MPALSRKMLKICKTLYMQASPTGINFINRDKFIFYMKNEGTRSLARDFLK